MDIPVYDEQRDAMNKFYNKQEGKRIFITNIGMPVAILDKDTWNRGEVLEIDDSMKVKVQLVDTGRIISVPHAKLRALHSDFMKLSKGTIPCCLVHVEPVEQHDFQWPPRCLEIFKALTLKVDNLEVFVHKFHETNKIYNVTLYSVCRDKNISINAQLVQLQFANSTGPESVQVEFHKDVEELSDEGSTSGNNQSTSKEPLQNTKGKSHRNNCKIVNIVNPGEFYVSTIRDLGYLEIIQRKIQNQVHKLNIPAGQQDFKVDDLCYVKTDTPDDVVFEWRRARVISIDASQDIYNVFLVDAGYKVCVKKDEMAPIPSGPLQGGHYAARQCHLSHIEPPAKTTSWPASSIDKLKSYCNAKKFEGYAVTMVGRSVNNSVPVILWGRIDEDDPLQPTVTRWKNINESLVKRGYAHLTEKFPTTFDKEIFEAQLLNQEFEQFIESLNRSFEPAVVMDPMESKLTAEITAVAEWKPLEPFKETIFLGVVTYVDNNGIFHLYNTQRRNLLDKMRQIADDVLRETLPSPVEKFWVKNQPCMAKYEVEDKFFRGIVRRVDKDKDKCLVQFVDYGNIEEINFKDMRKNLLFGYIPIQSYRFKFANIVPIKSDEPWPVEVLDKMHAYTTGHECAVTLNGPPVDNGAGYYEMTTLRMGCIDFVDYLLQHQFAVRAPSEVVQTLQLECLKPNGTKHNDTVTVKTEPIELDSLSRYREFFKQQDIKNETIISESSDLHEEESSDESVKYEYPSSGDTEMDDPNFTGDIEEFTPLYASTEIPQECTLYEFLQLDKDCVGFYGKTTDLLSPIDLQFCPEIPRHLNTHKCMEECLQDSVKQSQPVDKVDVNVAYVARYSEDGQYYRAIVNSERIIEDEVSVTFVDYLNTEMVKLEDIRELHINFRIVALRNLHLRLADVTVNPRYHAADVERELRALLNQKMVYAKIVKHASQKGSPHLVQLYAHIDDTETIYEKLIVKKFFNRTGKMK